MTQERPHIAIVGAGAVGLALAASLSQAGNDVSIVVRPGRLESLAGGISLTCGAETIRTRVAVVTSFGDIRPAPHLTLVAVKSYSLASLEAGLFKATSDTLICFVSNGVPWWLALDPRCDGVADIADPMVIARRVEPRGVLGGVVHAPCILRGPAAVELRSDAIRLSFGFADPAAMRDLAVMPEAAPYLELSASTDVASVAWGKLKLNLPSAAVALTTGLSLRDHARNPQAARSLGDLLGELSAIGAAMGFAPQQSHADLLARLLEQDNLPSLYRDFVEGRPSEAESQIFAVRRTADRLGLSTPSLNALARGAESALAHRLATG